ncbi:MAG: RNA polymerase sigma factor [Chloroflexi bacterium]|nr:MAG: RNA polymerase sigma factor [Chloroflexota bacterium]
MENSVLNLVGPVPTYADEQNHSLINRCLAGEDTAYVALYNMYAGMIYRLCYSLLQNKEDAEEVLQDSFEYAFRSLARYDANKSAFKTWLYQIAVSRCRNKRRRKWLPTFSINQLTNGDITDKDTPAPDEVSHLSEKQQQVWQALQQLSTKLRETAVLRYYDGLTYAEIGEILNIPTKTAESRMRLAHKALRELLAEVEW